MNKNIAVAVVLKETIVGQTYEQTKASANSENEPVLKFSGESRDIEEYFERLHETPEATPETMALSERFAEVIKQRYSTRRGKRKYYREEDLNDFAIWLADFRYFLIEAYDGDEDLRIIRQQFKDRMKTTERRNSFFKVTRMQQYFKEAKGDIR